MCRWRGVPGLSPRWSQGCEARCAFSTALAAAPEPPGACRVTPQRARPTPSPACAGQGRTRLYVDDRPLLVSSDLMVGLPVPEEELEQFTAPQRASLAGEGPALALGNARRPLAGGA